jgi:PBP1b-binding outer membrane lipoprotein LpoB
MTKSNKFAAAVSISVLMLLLAGCAASPQSSESNAPSQEATVSACTKYKSLNDDVESHALDGSPSLSMAAMISANVGKGISSAALKEYLDLNGACITPGAYDWVAQMASNLEANGK